MFLVFPVLFFSRPLPPSLSHFAPPATGCQEMDDPKQLVVLLNGLGFAHYLEPLSEFGISCPAELLEMDATMWEHPLLAPIKPFHRKKIARAAEEMAAAPPVVVESVPAQKEYDALWEEEQARERERLRLLAELKEAKEREELTKLLVVRAKEEDPEVIAAREAQAAEKKARKAAKRAERMAQREAELRAAEIARREREEREREEKRLQEERRRAAEERKRREALENSQAQKHVPAGAGSSTKAKKPLKGEAVTNQPKKKKKPKPPTHLCNNWKHYGLCSYEKCQFSHDPEWRGKIELDEVPAPVLVKLVPHTKPGGRSGRPIEK